jgi:outer membrane protein assembly factor BamA
VDALRRSIALRVLGSLVGGYSVETGRGRAQLTADLRRPNARGRTALTLRASGIEVLRYHGLGNATAGDGPAAYYRAYQSQYLVAPSYVVPLARGAEASLGAVAQYATTDLRRGTLLDAARPYGAGRFGQVGARFGIALDTRDRPVAATRGVELSAGGTLYPALWDVERAFGEAHGTAATYLSIPAPLQPTLALRAGGKRVWGTFPFHEAAFLGGSSTVRGWGEQRFAGHGAAYGNAELRLRLGRYDVLLPGEFGVFGLADAGRVYAAGERSGAWHAGLGGGVWIAPLRRTNTISLAFARGDERSGVYLRSGFLF